MPDTEKLYISKVTLPSGNIYYVKDAESRSGAARDNTKVNKSGDTITGQIDIQGAELRAKSTNIDRDGTLTGEYGNSCIQLVDKDDEGLGFIRNLYTDIGTNKLYVQALNEKTDGTQVQNYMAINVDRDGMNTYEVGSPAAFRTAIGLDALGYYGICGGQFPDPTTNLWWVLIAETEARIDNNAGITLLIDYAFTAANNATSTGTGILSVSVRTDTDGTIITNRSYAKWLIKMNELNNDDVIITYNNSTRSLQIWGKLDYPHKVMRVRPLSGSDSSDIFAVDMWTFTTSFNTNMYKSYPTGDGITVLTPTCDIQDQVNYNTNNGVKNLLSTEWFATNPVVSQQGTVESYDVKTGSITGFASASLTGGYLGINIAVDKMNNVLENGKTYILSWTVDSIETNTGIFGMRKNDNDSYSVGGSLTINKTGNYSVSYTHNSAIPVYFSLCLNTAGLSTDKRIAISNLMLREATIEDSTFEPYAKSNAELTADIPLTIHIDYSNIDAVTCDSTYNECLSALELGRAVIAMIQIDSTLMKTCFFGLRDSDTIEGVILDGSTSYYFNWTAEEDYPSIDTN